MEKNFGSDNHCSKCSNKVIKSSDRKLPCGHTCCLNCIQQMIRKNENKLSHLKCPCCTRLFTIPQGLAQLTSPEQIIYVNEKYRAKIEKSTKQSSLLVGGKIMGMAILHDDLFVCCRHKPEVIFKYEIAREHTFVGTPSEIQVPGVVWPRGMAANDKLHCLYITDWSKMFGGRLWRLAYQKNRDSPPVYVVADPDQQPFGVSYSSETSYILVTCATPVNFFKKGGSVHIFQDLRGSLEKLRVVEMPDVEIPRHTLLTVGCRFVTCHGWTIQKHGVTSFKQNEIEDIFMEKFYGGSGEQSFNRPLSMKLDSDDLILAVNYGNNRIDLLTEDLVLVRHLITAAEHNVSEPRHVCLHPSSGRMFVGQEDGQIHIFDAFIDGLSASKTVEHTKTFSQATN